MEGPGPQIVYGVSYTNRSDKDWLAELIDTGNGKSVVLSGHYCMGWGVTKELAQKDLLERIYFYRRQQELSTHIMIQAVVDSK